MSAETTETPGVIWDELSPGTQNLCVFMTITATSDTKQAFETMTAYPGFLS